MYIALSWLLCSLIIQFLTIQLLIIRLPEQSLPFFHLFGFSFSFFMRAAFSPGCHSKLFLLPISRPLLCFSVLFLLPVSPPVSIHFPIESISFISRRDFQRESDTFFFPALNTPPRFFFSISFFHHPPFISFIIHQLSTIPSPICIYIYIPVDLTVDRSGFPAEYHAPPI